MGYGSGPVIGKYDHLPHQHDSFHASNWVKSSPSAARMPRTTAIFEPSMWDRRAMANWSDRVMKEKKRLGLVPQIGSRTTTEVRVPTLNGWASMPTLPTVRTASDWKPIEQGPLLRHAPRAGSTNHE